MSNLDMEPAPEEPFRSKADHKEPDAGLENVINELRSVLSGLGGEKKIFDPAAVTESQAPSKLPETPGIPEKIDLPEGIDAAVLSQPQSSPDKGIPPENAADIEISPAESTPKVEEGVFREQPPPSDAEFWSGNVLGWPSQPSEEASLNEPTPEEWMKQQSDESARKVSELRPGLSAPAPDKGTPVESDAADISAAEPSLLAPTSPQKESVSEEGDAIVEQQVELSGASIEVPPPQDTDENVSPFVPGIQSLDETPIQIPPVPGAPFEDSVPPISKISMRIEPEEPMKVAPDNIPSFPDAPPVPIPGTLEHRPKPAGSDEELDMEDDGGSQGVIQIACIYPEGQEKAGQQFAFKLKIMGTKLTQSLMIDTVYIQPWNPNQLDIRSWCRASHLAGAALIFVLLSKKDKGLFDSLVGAAAEEGLKGRLIFLEQVGVRTVYADILDQMKRMAYGKN